MSHESLKRQNSDGVTFQNVWYCYMMKEITLNELHGIYFPFPLGGAVKFHINVSDTQLKM